MNNTVLKVDNLKTYFFTRRGVVQAVDGVGFELRKGECLCLVGESGCGKTVTALSVLRLIDAPGKTIAGEILYHQEDLLSCSEERMRTIRGNRIAMIFQDPQSSLNPVLTVAEQIMEPVRLHLKLKGKEAEAKAVSLMQQIGIPSASTRLHDYPHQFSGGMRQRVMIAMALSCEPEILIADEPTTALDVTIKAQILAIFKELVQKRQTSLIFITHDMGTVAEVADRIIVMYGGKIAETGTAEDIFDSPKHPYTVGLLHCLPDASETKPRLTPIPGMIPSLINPPEGCIFHPRCEHVMELCRHKIPEATVLSQEHRVACHLYSQIALRK